MSAIWRSFACCLQCVFFGRKRRFLKTLDFFIQDPGSYLSLNFKSVLLTSGFEVLQINREQTLLTTGFKQAHTNLYRKHAVAVYPNVAALCDLSQKPALLPQFVHTRRQSSEFLDFVACLFTVARKKTKHDHSRSRQVLICLLNTSASVNKLTIG